MSKYKIVSNPDDQPPDVNSVGSCYNECASDNNFIGMYYDTDAKTCSCYDEVILANTGVESDISVINYDTNGRLNNYKNTRDVTKTVTVDSADACKTACQLDSDGNISSTNFGYTYTESNNTCTCHAGYDIRPSDGDTTGKTDLIVVSQEEDYDPLTQYISTSPTIRSLTSRTNRIIYLVFKIASIIVALLVYSYFAHKDTKPFQIIKVIMIILFSELYLVYQAINIMILKNHRLSHTI